VHKKKRRPTVETPRKANLHGRKLKRESKAKVAARILKIADIVVAERTRRDLGDDVPDLARSISETGLLHPIVVCPDGRLIAGERRIEACKLLGWTEIPATVIDLEQVVAGEYAENAFRKDLTPSEVVAFMRLLEPIERARAKEREREGGRSKGSANFADLPGRALDKIG
jgi:ParB family chromosome partitioning protein